MSKQQNKRKQVLSQAVQRFTEALEERRMLAAQVVDNVLVVTGTNQSDNINVSLGSGEASFRVRVNGSEENFPLTGVTGIRINAGNGRDEIEIEDINETGNLQLPITISGGRILRASRR